MKALVLMLLRISTGLLLVIWGLIKIGSPESAIGVSDKYYAGMISGAGLQTALGIAEVLLGALVCLGLLRKFVYPAQSLVLFLGLALIWQYILDPMGIWLVEEENRRVLFFPSLCVFFATLIPLLYKEDDALSLDRKLGLNF
ncbi:MAG: hypothetical protein AB8B57_06385 [Congregibacter sp.]